MILSLRAEAIEASFCMGNTAMLQISGIHEDHLPRVERRLLWLQISRIGTQPRRRPNSGIVDLYGDVKSLEAGLSQL